MTIFLIRSFWVFFLFFFSLDSWANPLKLETKSLLIPYRGQGFITVVNTSDKTEYFRVIPTRIAVDTNGSIDYETRKNPKDLGLLVVPINLKLQAKQKRKIRVASLIKPSSGNMHSYYRVDFDHITKDRLEREKQMESASTPTSGMSVFIDAKTEKSVIVDVGSRNDFTPKTSTNIDSVSGQDPEGNSITQKRLTITNSGNVMLWLTGFETCDRSGKCKGKTWFKRLYPQEKYHHVLESGTVLVKYQELFGRKRTSRTVNIN